MNMRKKQWVSTLSLFSLVFLTGCGQNIAGTYTGSISSAAVAGNPTATSGAGTLTVTQNGINITGTLSDTTGAGTLIATAPNGGSMNVTSLTYTLSNSNSAYYGNYSNTAYYNNTAYGYNNYGYANGAYGQSQQCVYTGVLALNGLVLSGSLNLMNTTAGTVTTIPTVCPPTKTLQLTRSQ